MHLCLTVECITSGLHLSVFQLGHIPPQGGGTVTWPRQHRKYQAPKLIYTVMLWYRFVVQSPPPGGGGNCHFMTAPPPPVGGNRPDRRGEIAGGAWGM